MDELLTVQETLVLLGARDNLTYSEMASSMSRSKAWIQSLMKGLIEKGYLTHERYKHRSVTLTKKAKEYLEANQIKNERRS